MIPPAMYNQVWSCNNGIAVVHQGCDSDQSTGSHIYIYISSPFNTQARVHRTQELSGSPGKAFLGSGFLGGER